jgi:ubiquitin C
MEVPCPVRPIRHGPVNIFDDGELSAAYTKHRALWQAVKQTLVQQHVCVERQAEEVTYELFCALCCLWQLKDASLAQLPPLVEQAWQRAMLNTRLYRLFCEDVFGKPLEYSTINSGQTSLDVTVALYSAIFKQKPPQDIWSKPSEKANAASSFLDDLGDDAVRRHLRIIRGEEEADDIFVVGGNPEEKEEEQPPVGDDDNKTRKRRRLSAIQNRLDELLLDRPQHIRVNRAQPQPQPQIGPGIFQITVRTVDSRVLQFSVWDTMTVLAVKKLIRQKTDVPTEEQRLILTGKTLDDTQTLAQCNVKPDATLHLVPRAKGC